MECISKKTLLGVAAAGVLGMAGMARAAPIDFTTLFAAGALPTGTVNTITDANGENLLKAPGNTSAGVIQVGDWLYGVYDYKRISNVSNPFPGTAIGAGTAYTEMTGIFLLKVASKTPNGANFDFTFAPDAVQFATTFGIAVPAGTITRLYNDPSQNFTLSGTMATSIASATNGTVLGDVGFAGAGGTAKPGEGYTVVGGSDQFGALAGQPASFTLGTANFGLDPTDNVGFIGTLNLLGQASPFNGGGVADFLGSSTIKGSAGAGIAWTAASQTNLQFVEAVPVPTAAWMGLPMLAAIAGVGLLRRRATLLT